MSSLHGTSVAIDGKGVLIRGPSGSGKSDLALRLLDDGAQLIADDRTVVAKEGVRVILSAPGPIRGKLEVRGIGVLTCESFVTAPLQLIVDLVPTAEIERLPDPQTVSILNLLVRRVKIAPFQPSAAAKVRAAIRWKAAEDC